MSLPETSHVVLFLSSQQLSDITAHAERVYPEECCGLLVGQFDTQGATSCKLVLALAPLNNDWSPDALPDPSKPDPSKPDPSKPDPSGNADEVYTKRRRYSVDPKEMLRVQKQARDKGMAIIGVYHSHPDHVAEPSECDRALAWPEYAYPIVSVHGNGKENGGKAVDVKNWALDSEHQFQPEAMKVSPSAARDRMPVSA